MRKYVFFLAAALAAVSASLILNAQSLSGRRAPSFSLPDSGFVQHDILDYRGKWLLIEYMQTNCPHCKALTKLLESKKSGFKGKVEVLDIVIAPPDGLIELNERGK